MNGATPIRNPQSPNPKSISSLNPVKYAFGKNRGFRCIAFATYFWLRKSSTHHTV
jgi:hypothetical protein